MKNIFFRFIQHVIYKTTQLLSRLIYNYKSIKRKLWVKGTIYKERLTRHTMSGVIIVYLQKPKLMTYHFPHRVIQFL